MVRRPKFPGTKKAPLKRPASKARKSAARMTRATTGRNPQAPRRGRAKTVPVTATPIAVPPGWKLDDGGKSITVRVKTKDFLDALDVMNEVGRIAEQLEHHPDLHLERWNRLRITTYSHDVGKLTDRDERLAARVSDVLEKRGLAPT